MDAAHRRDPDVDELIDQITPLRHRALDLPLQVQGSLRFEGGDEHVTMFIGSDDGTEEAWTFSLAHPPAMLMRNTVAAPERPIGASRDSIRFPGVFWLPFAYWSRAVRFRAFKVREPSCGRRRTGFRLLLRLAPLARHV